MNTNVQNVATSATALLEQGRTQEALELVLNFVGPEPTSLPQALADVIDQCIERDSVQLNGGAANE